MLRSFIPLFAVALASVAGAAVPGVPPPSVLVVSDVFADVPDAVRPQPGKPITYAIAGKYESDIGTPVRGEKRATAAEIEAEVTKVLASQGFVKTQVGGALPNLALIITWGSAVLDTTEISMPKPAEDPNNPLDPNRPPDTNLVAMNARQMSLLVGADKASEGAVDQQGLNEINAALDGNRVYIFIAAFDMAAMMKTKEKKLLWRTRISIESTHYSLPESLSVMLASAAPYLGKEITSPVFIGEADRRKANVEVGTPYVVPDKPANETPKRK
jgi:hypothetical protein